MINTHLRSKLGEKLLVEHEQIKLAPDMHNEMCICEENTIAVSSEVFNFWPRSVLDHHITSSSAISETWCRRYKQLMYLQNTEVPSNEVPSNDLNKSSLTKVCIWPHIQLQQRTPFRKILIPSTSDAKTRLAHRLCHLDFLISPRQQDTHMVMEGGQSTVQQSCLYSELLGQHLGRVNRT